MTNLLLWIDLILFVGFVAVAYCMNCRMIEAEESIVRLVTAYTDLKGLLIILQDKVEQSNAEDSKQEC